MAVLLADVRARVETSLDDPTVTRILAAAVEAIDRSAGKAASEIETHFALGTQWISLVRRSTSIASIVERARLSSNPLTLAADDFRKVGDYRILRVSDGTNSALSWGAEVVVTYVPEVDSDVRDRVTLDLCQVDIEFRAFDREKVGDWEAFQRDYKARRRELLAQIREGRSDLT